jgi:hypothetical protein
MKDFSENTFHPCVDTSKYSYEELIWLELVEKQKQEILNDDHKF